LPGKIKSVFVSLLQDCFLLLGASAIVYGVYCIYEPVAYMVAGSFLLFAGLPKPKRGA
jgi:uncharacterized membrane protein